MTRFHALPKAALTVALGLLSTTGQVNGQSLDQQELARLIQAQALKIEQLEARLKAIEGSGAHAAPPASQATSAAHPTDPALETRVAKVEAAQAMAPKVSWSKGAPQFSNADGSITFRPRGRLFVDASNTSDSDFAERNVVGTEIRSVRLGAEGSYGLLGYVIEGDFADNGVAWKSAYASINHTLFGSKGELSIGNRLNDRGIDGSSSTSNTPFPDRNVVGTLILPQRGLFGVGLTERLTGERWHASFSVAGNDLDNAGDNNDSLTIATRAHWNPVLNDIATVHLGAWAFHEDIATGAPGVVRSSAISGHFNDLVKISPGTLSGADRGAGYGLEAAGFSGPTWITGEWGTRDLRGDGTAGHYDVDHDAWAVSAGVFLSGAVPAYAVKSGTWGKVKVQNPATAGGRGAWELKTRFESVNYDELPTGGTGHAWTLGANWYLSDYARIMLDAIRWQTDNQSGDYQGEDQGYTFNTRFQLVF